MVEKIGTSKRGVQDDFWVFCLDDKIDGDVYQQGREYRLGQSRRKDKCCGPDMCISPKFIC